MKTVLSIKDLVTIYNLVDIEIRKIAQPRIDYSMRLKKVDLEAEKEIEERLKKDTHYQDMIRVREALGNITAEVDTTDIDIKK